PTGTSLVVAGGSVAPGIQPGIVLTRQGQADIDAGIRPAFSDLIDPREETRLHLANVREERRREKEIASIERDIKRDIERTASIVLNDESMAKVFGKYESSQVMLLIVWAFRNRVPTT